MRNVQQTQQMLRDFGVPPNLASGAGMALPVAELGVAIAILPSRSAAYGAFGALLLLATFIAGVGANLARGRAPTCRCFGQLRSRPVSWRTLARNMALAAVAAFVVIAGWSDSGPGVMDWVTPLRTFELAIVALGVLTLLLLGFQLTFLARIAGQSQRLLERVSVLTAGPAAAVVAPQASSAQSDLPEPIVIGHPLGSLAPSFVLTDLQGGIVSLTDLLSVGRPLLLFFSDPQCGQCTTLLPEVAQWQRQLAGRLSLAVISTGPPDVNRAKTEEHGITTVLLQRDREVMTAYRLLGTPSTVLINEKGEIGGPLAQGDIQIREYVQVLLASGEPPARAVAETPPDVAPVAALADLDGNPVELARLQGQPAVLVFWNPDCGYCAEMLDQFLAWEMSPSADRFERLVISTGSVERNRALGFRSRVVMDPALTLSARYSVPGTPSAVLLDTTGAVVRSATGAGPIFELLTPMESETLLDTLVVQSQSEPVTMPRDARPIKQSCAYDELLSDGSIVLYNSCRQQMTTLNATAALIWECCDGEHDLSAIMTEVLDVFPDAPDLEHEVRGVMDQLFQAGLIAPASEAVETEALGRAS